MQRRHSQIGNKKNSETSNDEILFQIDPKDQKRKSSNPKKGGGGSYFERLPWRFGRN